MLPLTIFFDSMAEATDNGIITYFFGTIGAIHRLDLGYGSLAFIPWNELKVVQSGSSSKKIRAFINFHAV